MKTLIAALLLSTSLFASDTIIISADGNQPSVGFRDSSFSHNPERSFCFIGTMSEVCNEINYAAYKMQSNYGGGDHDNIKIISCQVKEVGGYYESERNEVFVEVNYLLTDDYGGNINVTKKIKECIKY